MTRFTKYVNSSALYVKPMLTMGESATPYYLKKWIGSTQPRCCASVRDGTSYHWGQCDRPGKVQDEGGDWWCGTHDNVKEAERTTAKNAKWQAEWDARYAAQAAHKARLTLAQERDIEFRKALEAIRDGDNDPRLTARLVLERFAAEV